jgi:hypothetical protein
MVFDTEWEHAEIELEIFRASGADLTKRCETGKSHRYLLECYRCGALHGEPCKLTSTLPRPQRGGD